MKSLVTSLCIIYLLFVTSAMATPQYSMTVLDSLGGRSSVAYDVNNRGQIVGSSALADGKRHACLWENGKVIDLGTFGGKASVARGINDLGQVIGEYTLLDGRTSTFLWQSGVQTAYLGLDKVYSINNVGQIVGTIIDPHNGTYQTYIWQSDGLHDAAALGYKEAGYYIDDNGVIAGTLTYMAASGYMDHHACLWKNGSTIDLGSLGGYRSLPQGISGNGYVVGWSQRLINGQEHGFLWKDNTMIDLGALTGGDRSRAYGVNNSAQVVGYSTLDSDGSICHAAYWDNGSKVDLGSLGRYSLAEAINESGLIVGQADRPDGENCAVMWTQTPVPEPSSAAALIFGIMGIATTLRRRQK